MGHEEGTRERVFPWSVDDVSVCGTSEGTDWDGPVSLYISTTKTEREVVNTVGHHSLDTYTSKLLTDGGGEKPSWGSCVYITRTSSHIRVLTQLRTVAPQRFIHCDLFTDFLVYLFAHLTKVLSGN